MVFKCGNRFLQKEFTCLQCQNTRTFINIIFDQGKLLCALMSEVRDLEEIIVEQAHQMSEVMCTIKFIGLRIGARNVESKEMSNMLSMYNC